MLSANAALKALNLGVLALGLVAASTSTTAAAAVAVAAADPATMAAALRFAQVTRSEQLNVRVVDRAMVAVAADFRKDADFKAMEADYPGITNAVLASLRQVMMRDALAELPKEHQRVAAIVAMRLSRAEIEDVTRFYESPVGQKVLNGATEHVDFEAIAAEVNKHPNQPLSNKAADREADKAAVKMLSGLSRDDLIALSAFAEKPYSKKLDALNEELDKLDDQMMNEPTPKLDAAIEAATTDTIEKYIAAADAKRKKK